VKDGWPEPEEIGGDLLAVPTLKETLIPEALKRWVLDTAERFQCPPDYFATAALVGLGQLLGRKIAIRPKQYDNWYEHANTWGGIVAPPGFMKSPAIQEAFHPLFRLERKARGEYEDAKRAAEVDREIAESNRNIIRNRLKAKDLKDTEREHLARQLSDTTFQEPICRRYIVNDVTVEKVGELLSENPNGLVLLCDELSGWMGLMELPEYKNARGFYLSAWNSKTPASCDRIGRGSIFIEATCLSVYGALVPGTLERYLRSTYSGEHADGFIERFQLLVYPDLPSKWHYVDRPIDSTARTRAFAVMERVGSLTVNDFHATEVEEEPPFVRFTLEAQSIWIDAHEWAMRLARSTDEHPVLRSHFGKYPKLLAALALVFHALRVAEGQAGEAIEKQSVDQAWAWAQYLERHARRIYQLALNPGETAARLIAKKLGEQRLPNPFSVREIQRKQWAGLQAKGDVLAGLEVLEDCNWVYSQPPPTGKPGRPSSRFWINPKVAT
jgi:putative DNA primase/helicase